MATLPEKQVFRSSIAALYIGLLFGGLPLVMGIGGTIQWFNEGIRVNEVVRKDVGALVMIWAFLALFIVAGSAFVVGYRNYRAEVDKDGLTIFNFFGRVALRCGWSEVTVYAKASPPKSGRYGKLDRNSRWEVTAGGRSQTMPYVRNIGLLHAAVISGLPQSVLKSVRRLPTPDSTPNLIEARMRRGTDVYTMFFSVIWNGFLLSFLATTGWALTQGKQEPFTFAFFLAVGILFLLIPLETFTVAWRRFLFGRLRSDEHGLTHFDGKQETKIDWSEVRFVDQAIIDRGEDGTMKRLMIVANNRAIEIDDGFKEFGGVLAMTMHYASDDAPIYL